MKPAHLSARNASLSFSIFTFLISISVQAAPDNRWMCMQREFGKILEQSSVGRAVRKIAEASKKTQPEKATVPDRIAGLPSPNTQPELRDRASRFLQKLYKKPLGSFFSGQSLERPTVESLHLANPQADVFEAELDRFMNYFDASSRWKRMINALPDEPDFVSWVNHNKRELLSREQVQYLVGKNYDFEHFRAKLASLYEQSKGNKKPTPNEVTISFLTRDPLIRDVFAGTYNAGIKTLAFAGGVVYMATVTGPVSKILTAYLSPVSDPLENASKKGGSEHLQEPSRLLQDFLTKANTASQSKVINGRERLVQLQKELRETKKLGPDQWDKVMKEKYSKLYYDSLLAVYAYLPSNIRDGRGLYFDFYVRQPMGFAVAASQFKQEAMQLTQRYELLAEKKPALVARGRELAKSLLSTKPGTHEYDEFQQISEQIAFLQSYPSQLKTKRRQVATAMVLWRMSDLQYNEVVSPRDSQGNPVRTDYSTIREWLGYEDYSQGFIDEINEMIDLLDNYLVKVPPKKAN